MRDVLQNTARKFKIYMADSTTPTAGKTGLSSFTVYLAKDGGSENTVSPTIQERGHGWYEVTPLAAHRDTLGENAWTFTATGAVDFPMKETVVAVDSQSARYGAAATGDQMALTSGTRVKLDAVQPDYAPAKAGDAMTLTSGTRVQLAATQPDYAPAKAGDAMALTSGERTSLAGTIETELLNDASGGAFLAGIASQLQALFDQAGDIPIATLVNLISAGVWTNTTRTLTAVSPVTVGGYSTGQSPVDLLTSTISKVTAIDAVLTALTEVVATVTRFKAAALSQAPTGGGGGGSGDASQATLEEVQETVEAIAVSLAGTAPQVVSRVAGGTITAYVSDDFRVRSGTQLKIPVNDPVGALNTKLAAIGIANLAFAASAPNKPAAQITGTIASLAHASGVLTISVEIVACGNGLQPGDYLYQIQSTQTHSGEFDDFVELSGTLILERRVVLPRG